jgi:hypothetical protein
MIISSLEKMEEIVRNNRQLSWDGWDVVKLVPASTAWKSPSGVFIKNRWYLRNRFRLMENGWKIPEKLVR